MGKISMFTDKVYEDMDDISRLVEPIESTINNDLSKFPDEIEIIQEDILKLHDTKWGWGSLAARSIIESKSKELDLKCLYREAGTVSNKFFKFEVRDLEEGEQVTINFETGILSHKLFMVKHTIGFDEKELEDMAKESLTSLIRCGLHSNRVVDKPRLNEIADLFGAKEVKSDRSYRGKVRKFCKHMDSLVDNKKLDIRDLALCAKFSNWIVLYVKDGNLAALNNITRIKIMMHEERPIYSIEERSVE